MKQLNFTFLLAILMSMLGVEASAHDIAVENAGKNIYYVWTNNKTELAVSYQGNHYDEYNDEYSGDIVIPESVIYNGKNYPVTSINNCTFRNCGALTAVFANNNITNIDECAFADCVNLESFTIPASVTSIGENCFYRSGLVSVYIPKNVKTIGEHIFFGCQNLTSVIVDGENPAYDSRDNCNGIVETASNKLIAACTTTFIPNTVTSFGNAFNECYLTSLSIPNSITSIGSYAFRCCHKLESITISSSVTSIANGIFYMDESIARISVDSENPVYDSRDNCNAIIETASNTLIAGCPTTVIPNTVTAIGGEAFRYTAVTSVTIPPSVVDIDWSSFLECHQLKSVTFLNPTPGNFPETIGIDDDCIVYVPKGSKAAYEAVFPKYIIVEDGEIYTSIFSAKTVEGIDMTFKVFREREKTCMVGDETYGSPSIPSDYIGSVTIPSMVNGYKVTRIGSCAFNECGGLTSVSIPETVSSIGANAFRRTRITEIEFPNSLESIENGAFQDCGGLTSIFVPKSVTHIDPTAFEGENISSITVEDSNPVYDSRDNCNAIIESATNTLVRGCKNTLIPKSVTALTHSSFSCCPLAKIVIPESVTTIGHEAFVACRKLSEVNIPNSVTRIEHSTFRYCDNLTNIVLPEGITYIGEVAFSESGLKSITFPKNFPTIEEGAFWCGLTSVTTYMETPVTITKDIFPSRKEATLYVPKGCKAAYLAADYWKEFKEIKEIMSVGEIFTAKTVEGVDMTFKVISEIEKTCMVGDEQGEGIHSFPTDYSGGITIPSTANGYKVTRIGSWAFNWCRGLTSVNIPETVTSIGVQAFISTSLTSVTLPNSLESIEDGAFECCEGLTSMFVPKSVTGISPTAFGGENISSIIVEDGNPVYDSRDNCNAVITTATNELIIGCNNSFIPKTVTKLGSHAFGSCYELSSIMIPAGVTSIDFRAFHQCYSLTSITIPSTVISINDQAFLSCSKLMSITFLNPIPGNFSEDIGIDDNCIVYVPIGSKAAYEELFPQYTIVEKVMETDVSDLDDAIYIKPFSARIRSDVNIEIRLKNAQAASAYNFELVLPEGVTMAKDSDGKYIDALSDRHSDHSRTFNDRGDNVYSFATLSGNSEVLTGNDGTIRLVTLHVAEDVVEGPYPIYIKNATYSLPDGSIKDLENTVSSITLENYILGDVNGNNMVDIGDAVSIVNILVGKPSSTFIEKAADTNKNSQIDIGDAVTIVNFLVGKTTNLSRSTMTTMDEKEPQ